MNRFRSAALALGAALLAACDGATSNPLAPAESEPLFDHGDTISVEISAPASVTTAQNVTASAYLELGSGTWRYTWQVRHCTGASSTSCSPGWTQIADGTGVTSATEYVTANDWWVEFLVHVKDIYGHVLDTDVHRVTGPRSFSTPLSVSYISGASYVTSTGDQEYTAVASGGTGSYSYSWEQNVNGGGWEFIGTSNPILACINPLASMNPRGPQSYTLQLRVTVTSGTETASATYDVQVSLPNGFAYPCTGGW